MIAESSTDTNNSHKFSLLHNSIPETTVHALSGWTPVFILIIALPVIALFATIIHFGVNIPYQDDYNAVFDFLNRFTSTADLQEKARLLFDNHNEHRIAFARVIIYGCYRVIPWHSG